jgi:hypothetical protein
MIRNKSRFLAAGAAVMLLLSAFPAAGSSYAQATSRTFPETGKTVSGRFLTYWNTHGQLAQQGFPISNEMQEVSDTDGKTYTVQYFERAIFELHPENAPPFDVLLSLLGNFLYKQKYPSGAPNQVPNNNAPSRFFTETGHRVGGKFLNYWNNNGGLAQQGYPISDEFQETSSLNGKIYTVQYFERAVFELHPENAPPYDVLLSQLGKFRYDAKYAAGGGGQPPRATPTSVAQPPPPTAVPGCDQGVPDAKSATVTPKCGKIGTVFQITAQGFFPNEQISFWLTAPDGSVLGTPAPVDAGNHPGAFRDEFDSSFLSGLGSQANGIWAITYQGATSNHQSIVWFKVVP